MIRALPDERDFRILHTRVREAIRMCNLQYFTGALLLTFSFSACAGCGPVSPQKVVSPPPEDGHQRMLELLQEVERYSSEDPIFGDSQLRLAQEHLAQLGDRSNVAQRLFVTVWIGHRQIELGNNDLAVERLAEALQLYGDNRDQIPVELEADLLMALAVAHFRVGEASNCIACQTPDSCIFPITAAGIHSDQRGSKAAIDVLERLLARSPGDVKAKWLLNIAHMTIGDYPAGVPADFLIDPEHFSKNVDFPRFANIASDLGLNTVNVSGGAIADDFDNDGWIDIVTSCWHPSEALRYFRNNRDGSFSDTTQAAGLVGINGGLNLVQADYDNDGDTDVLVLRGAWRDTFGIPVNSLLRNDGEGRFRDVTFEAGLGEVFYPTQTAAWADYDNDGDLDLYIGNEDYPCQLFQNQGHGKFLDVARKAGVENGRFAKGVTWGDFNGDNFPDLYVSNLEKDAFFKNSGSLPGQTGSSEILPPKSTSQPERTNNRLYRNNRNGTFTDVAPELGVTRPAMSFPTWFWDFDNDGVLDIFAGSWSGSVNDIANEYLGQPVYAEPDCLYQGDGQGGFRNVLVDVGLNRVTLPMGANFGDLDNDGYLDFYLGTGAPSFDELMPNLMFRNRGGERFEDVTTAGGFGHLQKGHGIAFADFDNDGDQDIFAQMGGAFPGDVAANALYENPGFGSHWITVQLIGRTSNRSAIGARVRIDIEENGMPRTVYRWVNSGGSFGANPLRQAIGVGQAKHIQRLEVLWPTTGDVQSFENLAVDQFIEIGEGEGAIRRLDLTPTTFRRRGKSD